MSRQRELALRLALGARPSHLARRFVAESLLLSLAGAVLGVLIAVAGVPALLRLEPTRLPRAGGVAVDWTVLAFALAVSLLAALAIGLLPALRAAKRDVRDALADTRRSRGGGLTGHRVRGALVASQLALTIVLLAGAGLLGRSFLKLLAVDPGFRTGGALVMDVWLPDRGDPVARTRFLEQLMTRLGATPGVEHVGGISSFPLRSEGPGNGTFLVLQRPDEFAGFDDWDRLRRQPGRSGNAEYRVASRDYFAALGIPLLRGRLFQETDVADAPHVALVSESLARTQWPGQDPLGRLIEFGNMDGDPRPFTVVGVVGDVRDRGAGATPRPTIYGDYRQRPRVTSSFYIAIQGRFDAGQIMARGRQIAQELDPQVPTRFQSLEEVVSASFADRRFVLLLLGLFGGLALLLATLGVYGLMAYVASERTSEIGVRMALGAKREDVVRLLVNRGAALAAAGIALGLAASLAATRVLAGFLYGVGAADPASFAATCLVLLAAALAASWIPARRAARLDPVRALRHE